MQKFRVEVICVGSELLYDRVNTDINILSSILSTIGLTIKKCLIVPDDEEEIISSVRVSLEETDILIITGGLGPTSDDITRESISKLLNRKLIYSENIWSDITKKFAKRNIVLPEINKKQAYIVEGAEVIKNYVGTAPGLIISQENKKIALFPGPPIELKPMAEYFVSELHKHHTQNPLYIHRFGISGVSESVVEEKIYPVMKNLNIPYTILAHPQMIEILITSKSSLDALKEIEDTIKKEFNENYLGVNPPSLPKILGDLIKEKKIKLAIAESCTGGLASKLLIDIPGSSEYLQGAVIAYSNMLKKRILKVPKPILRKEGAVSAKTAIYMAKGVKKICKADISISFTGIAGPSGGTLEKPIGLTFIGLGLPNNKYEVFRFIFSGNRERIREQAAYKGFDLMIKKLKAYYEDKKQI